MRRLSRAERQEVDAIADRAMSNGRVDLSMVRQDSSRANDVSEIISRFRRQAEMLDAFRMEMPCIHRKHREQTRLIPIDLSSALRPPSSSEFISHGQHVEQGIFREVHRATESDLGVSFWPTSVMIDAFRDLLRDFLVVKIAAFKKTLMPRPIPTVQGLSVTVHTKNRGAKVICSPALLFDQDRGFGGTLSTPVKGYLQPGIYVFGIRDGGVTRWDDVEEEIPPRIIRTGSI